ncbi:MULTISPECIES: hypothetical protein [unclassified Microbacterium]|uniref:hypothetical protein n=1 Tax=unclassified Microbacterium TaxID=2609290 RepID=UPI0034372F22
MGYTEGIGPEGTPDFNVTPQTRNDLQRLRNLVIQRGNRFKGTTNERNAFTDAGFAVEGQEWFDTTMGCLLIRRGTAWKREISFRTFTLARGGMTDNQTFFQVPTEDATKDTEPAFSYAYNGANGQITPEAGVYMLSVKAHPGGVATGTSFVQIRGTVQGLLGRGAFVIAADPWMSTSSLFRADGTEGFIVDIQKVTGSASAGSGALHMTKLTTL